MSEELMLTPEQLEAHRNRQRAYARRSMSDDEFESRYDPQAYQTRLLIEALDRIAQAIQDLHGIPPRPERFATPSASHSAHGTVEV